MKRDDEDVVMIVFMDFNNLAARKTTVVEPWSNDDIGQIVSCVIVELVPVVYIEGSFVPIN
jgi:hypothetical protein